MKILLQTSIAFAEDDWHVGRFSLLTKHLRSFADVTARNREADGSGNDAVLSGLSHDTFDQVWLFGVDGGVGLSELDLAGVNRFRREGGGLLTARDHQNMGLWLRRIEGIGNAHYFHDPPYTDPDPSRCCPDDIDTPTISWPNYHSGQNGNFQRIEPVEAFHPLLARRAGGLLEYFPAHPHEGAVAVPPGDARARTIARGRSQVTGRSFDLVVALDHAPGGPGRAIAESSFHHFADYNWNPGLGAPSFVTELLGDEYRRHPERLDDIRAYVANVARWLAGA